MSHELYEHDHMVSANNVTPWHSLGTVHSGTMDLDTALILSKVDFEVGKHPVFTRLERADESFDVVLKDLLIARAANPTANFGELLTAINYELPVDGKFATVRHDINYPLGVVGADYTVWQNRDHFALASELLAGGDIEVETAGSLKNGRIVWLLCRLGDDFVVGGDRHEPYMLFTSSHDGSTKLQVMPTMVRVVCANTLRFALDKTKASWTASHTKTIHGRAREAAETLRLARTYMAEFQAEAERLIDTTISEMRMEEILQTVVPDPEPDRDGKISERALDNAVTKRGKIRQVYNLSPTVGEFRGTGWGVVQAFNAYDLWGGRIHGGEGMRAERQALRIIGGDTMANTSKVRELVLATNN
jgi:phage/plasmid-like protein (TIGR03299 family)